MNPCGPIGVQKSYEIPSSNGTFTATICNLDPKIPDKICLLHDHMCRIRVFVYAPNGDEIAKLHQVRDLWFLEQNGGIVQVQSSYVGSVDAVNNYRTQQ